MDSTTTLVHQPPGGAAPAGARPPPPHHLASRPPNRQALIKICPKLRTTTHYYTAHQLLRTTTLACTNAALSTNWGHLFKHSSLLTGLATNGLYYYSGAPTARGRGTRGGAAPPPHHLASRPPNRQALIKICPGLRTTTHYYTTHQLLRATTLACTNAAVSTNWGTYLLTLHY